MAWVPNAESSAVAAALVRFATVPFNTTSPDPFLLTVTLRPSSCRSGAASGTPFTLA